MARRRSYPSVAHAILYDDGAKVEQEVLRESLVWERLLAVASLLLIAIVTFVVARWLGRSLKGTTRFGLHGLGRLAAPVTLLVTLLSTWVVLLRTPSDPPIVELAIEFFAIVGLFWLAARVLDVVWSTGRRSARLRRQPGAPTALLATRQLGKAALALGLIVVFSIRIGVAEQLYLALGVIGAAIAFAARRPIANAFGFAEMVLSPPFLIGDKVRIGDFRGGEVAEGEVIAISLATVTIRSKRRTMVVVDNARIGELRVENLSTADRRRLEFVLPIDETIPAEKLRSACAVIEDDLRDSRYVSEYRAPHVWISGYSEGLNLKVSAWLRQGADRRDAQRDLLLSIRSRFDELTGG